MLVPPATTVLAAAAAFCTSSILAALVGVVPPLATLVMGWLPALMPPLVMLGLLAIGVPALSTKVRPFGPMRVPPAVTLPAKLMLSARLKVTVLSVAALLILMLLSVFFKSTVSPALTNEPFAPCAVRLKPLLLMALAMSPAVASLSASVPVGATTWPAGTPAGVVPSATTNGVVAVWAAAAFATAFNCDTFTASVSAEPAPTLVIRR